MYVGTLALIHVLLLDGNVFKYFIMKVTISFKKIWELEKRKTVFLFSASYPRAGSIFGLRPEKFVLRWCGRQEQRHMGVF